MKDHPAKVIFVAGTAYSGSTHLNLVIGNDPNALACGELHAFARPYLPYHLEPQCGCGEVPCKFWQTVGEHRKNGHGLYMHLFDAHPELNVIVDSSKDLRWIRPMSSRLRAEGVDVKLLLIWKTPAEYFKSKLKRGELHDWVISWIRYHQAFLASFSDCITVNYSRFLADPDVLKQVCHAVDIPWFAGKVDYPQRPQHVLFGNSSTRIGLASVHQTERGRIREELSRQQEQLAKSTESFDAVVSAQERNAFARLVAELESRDVARHLSTGSTSVPDFRWPAFLPWYVAHRATGLLKEARLWLRLQGSWLH